MRQHSLSLDVSITNGAAGAAKPVDFIHEKWVQVAGTFSATFSLEISLDGGSNYFAYVTGLTAAGVTKIEPPASHIRMRMTTFTSGLPVIAVAGFAPDA